MERLCATKIAYGNYELNLLKNDESMETIVKTFVDMADQQDRDEPMYIVNLGDIVNKYKTWTSVLPTVKPFYAVKANDDHVVLHLLATLGVNFDCASKDEIKRVMSLGVSPDRIVYSHPCKHASMLKFAAEKCVTLTTFDNVDELQKIKRIHPRASWLKSWNFEADNSRCLIRLKPSMEFKVKVQLGHKYGCDHHEVRPLLRMAKYLGLEIIGVHFHVGYLCQEAAAYEDAICRSRDVFEMGRQLGFNMTTLDIGGGFPGKDSQTCRDLFEKVACSINSAINTCFPNKDVTVIAEPGEYFVASAFTLATKIISMKIITSEHTKYSVNGRSSPTDTSQTKRLYFYLNDGFYGSFASVTEFSEDGIYPVQLKTETDNNDEVYECTLFGPTCDSIDVLPKCPPMKEQQVGEWIYFSNMGAYTTVVASRFNGMPKPNMNYVCSDKTWYEVFPETERDLPNCFIKA